MARSTTPWSIGASSSEEAISLITLESVWFSSRSVRSSEISVSSCPGHSGMDCLLSGVDTTARLIVLQRPVIVVGHRV